MIWQVAHQPSSQCTKWAVDANDPASIVDAMPCLVMHGLIHRHVNCHNSQEQCNTKYYKMVFTQNNFDQIV